MRARRRALFALLALLFALHLDLWWWNDGRPVAGLPLGLAYHLAYCAAAAGAMALAVAWAWPRLPAAGEDEGEDPAR